MRDRDTINLTCHFAKLWEVSSSLKWEFVLWGVHVVVAVLVGMPLVGWQTNEFVLAGVLAVLGEHGWPVLGTTCETFIVVVNDVCVDVAISRHIRPEGVASDRAKVKLLRGASQGFIDSTVSVAQRAMVVEITPV